MNERQIEAGANLVVKTRFEVAVKGVVPVRSDRGEAFGANDALSVDVRGGGRLLDEETVRRPRTVGRFSPEFTHRHVSNDPGWSSSNG